MMGSRRKVARVFDELVGRGHTREALAKVHAPIGLDIGAESPAEIAVSIVGEILRFTADVRRDRGATDGGGKPARGRIEVTAVC